MTLQKVWGSISVLIWRQSAWGSLLLVWHRGCSQCDGKPQPNSLNSICTVSLPPVREQVRSKRGGWGWEEKGEACGSRVLLSQWAEKTAQTETQAGKFHAGNFPEVIQQIRARNDKAQKRGTKATRIIYAVSSYWKGERRDGGRGREGVMNWRERAAERSGQTGTSSVRLSILSPSEEKWSSITQPSNRCLLPLFSNECQPRTKREYFRHLWTF